MELKINIIRGEICGETIKNHHCKTKVQNNIYWTPEKFKINIPSQPPPFRAGALSQNNQRVAPGGIRGNEGSLFQRASFRRGKSYSCQSTAESGNTIPKNIFSNSFIHKNFVDIRELEKSASCWPSKAFS